MPDEIGRRGDIGITACSLTKKYKIETLFATVFASVCPLTFVGHASDFLGLTIIYAGTLISIK